jgi:hypothetical protein
LRVYEANSRIIRDFTANTGDAITGTVDFSLQTTNTVYFYLANLNDWFEIDEINVTQYPAIERSSIDTGV